MECLEFTARIFFCLYSTGSLSRFSAPRRRGAAPDPQRPVLRRTHSNRPERKGDNAPGQADTMARYQQGKLLAPATTDSHKSPYKSGFRWFGSWRTTGCPRLFFDSPPTKRPQLRYTECSVSATNGRVSENKHVVPISEAQKDVCSVKSSTVMTALTKPLGHRGSMVSEVAWAVGKRRNGNYLSETTLL